MNNIEIPEKGIELTVPQHWDEMQCQDLYYCLKEAVLASRGILSPEEAKVKCLYRLLDIQRDWKTIAWEKLQSKEKVAEKNSNVYLLAEQLMGFLFHESREKLEVNYNTVMNHFPMIRAGKKRLHGPAHLLSDLSLGEFRAALEEMGEYFDSEGKDEEALSRMIACLYRPERVNLEVDRQKDNWDGKLQEPFNRAKIYENSKWTSQMGLVHRMGILLWFTYTLQYIQTKDLEIGGRRVNFSILFPKGENDGEKKKGAGFTGVLYSVAETGIFGKASETDRAGIFDIFTYLYDKELENRKIKAKQLAQKGGKK